MWKVRAWQNFLPFAYSLDHRRRRLRRHFRGCRFGAACVPDERLAKVSASIHNQNLSDQWQEILLCALPPPSDGKAQLTDQSPDIPVRGGQVCDDLFNLSNGVFIHGVFTPQFDIGFSVRDAHQNGFWVSAFCVKRVNAVIVPVANGGKFAQALGVLQNRIANLCGATVHFGQPLYQIDPRARRVQSQEDDNRDVLVRTAQTSDQMDQQAFCVGPHVIQPADQQDQPVKAIFKVFSQLPGQARLQKPLRNRTVQLRYDC